MGLSNLKRVSCILLLASLVSGLTLVPRFADLVRAQTAPSALQCGPGGVVSLAPVTPIGTSASPVGTTATIPGATCTPVSSSLIVSAFGATATVELCGAVSAYTAPTSSAGGSLTINGVIVSIPAGFSVPSYVASGGSVIVGFLIPGGQLVEISPGFCGTAGGTGGAGGANSSAAAKSA